MSTNPYQVQNPSLTLPQDSPRRPRKLIASGVLLIAVIVVWFSATSDIMSELRSKGLNAHPYHLSVIALECGVTACLLLSASLWWRGHAVGGIVTLGVAVLAFFGLPFLLFLVLFP